MGVEDHPGPATGGTSRPRYGIEQSICKHRGVVSESLVGVRFVAEERVLQTLHKVQPVA